MCSVRNEQLISLLLNIRDLYSYCFYQDLNIIYDAHVAPLFICFVSAKQLINLWNSCRYLAVPANCC